MGCDFMISIIVPVYNVEKYLDRCIESIINQTYKNIEIILVDDGSTDKSGEICDNYANLDTRIEVIHKVNGGVSSARNKGLDIANGEYIGFVDSDDYIHPKMYETLLSNLIDYDADISMCNYIKGIEDNYNFKKIKNNLEILNTLEQMNCLYNDKVGQILGCYLKLYKRELFNSLRFKENKIFEDWLIVHQIHFKSNKMVYTSDALYYYRKREGSIIHSEFNIKKLDALYVFKERILFFNNYNLNLRNKSISQYINAIFKYYYKAKKELGLSDKNLKHLRKDFKKVYFICMKSNQFYLKEKMTWIMFIFNPKLYELYLEKRHGKKLY